MQTISQHHNKKQKTLPATTPQKTKNITFNHTTRFWVERGKGFNKGGRAKRKEGIDVVHTYILISCGESKRGTNEGGEAQN